MADRARTSGWVDISIDVGRRLGIRPGDVSRATLRQLQAELRSVAAAWTEEMLRVWPVKTRRSQQNWVSRVRGLTWELQNPVDYVEYVHLAGTPRDDVVWKDLELHSEQLLVEALPRLRALVDADVGPAAGRRARTQGEGDLSLFRSLIRAFERQRNSRRAGQDDRQRARSRSRTRARDR